jgi:predicted PhzF superfamily epimerase YddE/YHI9
MSNIVQELNNGLVSVSFTKADGSLRAMKATLSTNVSEAKALIEAAQAAGTLNTTPSASGQISVVEVTDAGVAQWRSLNVNTAKITA